MARGAQHEPERLGRFRLVGRIAQGGMAEIYLARPEDPEATDAGAEVALKRLLPTLRTDREFLDMFRDEARLAANLDHPNIVRILEVGDDGENPYIAMELLRGVNIRDLLSRLQTLRRSMPVELGVFVAIGALRALEHAHGYADANGRPMNVVHRDVSPQNVLCTYDGAVKLVDFGVAKAEGRLHHTRAGLIKGKFAYMSPEQVDGKELDGRSDLFALAEVFYELLLRRHPFYAPNDMDVLRKILDEDAPDPRELDPDFPAEPARALLKALAKKPSARHASAKDMREALQTWLNGHPRRPTSGELAAFVRDAFSDRLREEERARQKGDDEALVTALRVGRAARIGMVTGTHDKPKVVAPAPVTPSELDSGASEELPTLILADPGIADIGDVAPGRPEPRGRDPRPGSVRVGPADPAALGPRIVPSERAERAADPAERAATPPRPAFELREPLADVGPGEAPQVATRGTTVRSGASPHRGPPRRLDLIVFVVGLGALVGALIFALGPSGGPATTIEVRSRPSGARIFLDGQAAGLLSPSTVPLPSSGDLRIEMKKAGFETCLRVVSADAEATPLSIECALRPRPAPSPSIEAPRP